MSDGGKEEYIQATEDWLRTLQGKSNPGCHHQEFTTNVNIVRVTQEAAVEDVAYFMAEIRIACNQCGEEFSFVGLPRGLSPREPMAGPFGLEARLPIVPVATVDKSSETFRVDVRPMDGPA